MQQNKNQHKEGVRKMENENMAEVKVVISVDTTELDKAIDKAKELSALLKDTSKTAPDDVISY